MTLLKLVVHPFRAGVQYCANLRRPVQTGKERRCKQIVEQARRGAAVGASPGVVEREETEAESRRHGLAVVEFRMRCPFGIEDVRLVPVSKVAPN